MDLKIIPVITVSYNSPELINNLLTSFRQFYSNPVYVIDGSEPEPLAAIKGIASSFNDVKIIDFGYNIHHGPGMAWAIKNLPLSGPVLFLDSDIAFLRAGVIEALLDALEPTMYGVGGVAHVNRDGFDIPYQEGAVAYLHPPCMLCNIDVMRQWPLPIKHGAPMVEAMLALHDVGMSTLLGRIDWVINDLTNDTEKFFFNHEGRGTVVRTGSYHLDEFIQTMRDKSTNHSNYSQDLDSYNRDLLSMIPKTASSLVEVGCNSGALAAAYKQLNTNCNYGGIELDPAAAQSARQHCDSVMQLNIDSVGDDFFKKFSNVDCWIFGDVLEHLVDPWRLISRIRAVIPENGCIVACIPNAQHWTVQAKLSIGDFRYQDGGLLDRTHLRWFTRATIFELFSGAGFQIIEGHPRIFDEPAREKFLPAIRMMAQCAGADPELAVNDSLAMQYVVRAVPVA